MSNTVKIIVTLSEGQYEALKDVQFGGIGSRMIFNAVKHGTPLPKGHGRLIDADAIEYDEESLETDSSQVFLVVDKDSIDLMPTIVEADKENDT